MIDPLELPKDAEWWDNLKRMAMGRPVLGASELVQLGLVDYEADGDYYHPTHAGLIALGKHLADQMTETPNPSLDPKRPPRIPRDARRGRGRLVVRGVERFDCAMITDWKADDEGEPGEEIECGERAAATLQGHPVCANCFLSIYLAGPDMIEDVKRIKQ